MELHDRAERIALNAEAGNYRDVMNDLCSSTSNWIDLATEMAHIHSEGNTPPYYAHLSMEANSKTMDIYYLPYARGNSTPHSEFTITDTACEMQKKK